MDRPGAVAYAGPNAWGDFSTHRPGTCPAMVDALLTGTVGKALKTWSLTSEPIVVDRLWGPAGPPYARGVNGSHRLHTARLLNLPAIWAEVRQDTLPPHLRPDDAGAVTRAETEAVLICWQGLLARGLVAGYLTESAGFPQLRRLYPTYAAAPWLPAVPERAIAWAQAYERMILSV